MTVAPSACNACYSQLALQNLPLMQLCHMATAQYKSRSAYVCVLYVGVYRGSFCEENSFVRSRVVW